MAFITSIVSLFLHYQDKPVLKIISKYYLSSDLSAAHIALSIVNAGKRPLIVRMWGGNDNNGDWVGEFIGKQQKGIRLGEKDRYDIELYKENMIGMTPDDDVIFSELWVEDSLGKRYTVPNSRKYVSKLLNT